ncbi:MAG: hydroxysqualene dehydroxylase HpnE [Magnetovibrio sp.]|nr:hydroxysqualene dehydroxylase HpnE [Magnetovibrio sp.]
MDEIVVGRSSWIVLMTAHVHVVGAGLAGLSAAVRLADADVQVTVHEGAKFAGGRCRSFYDDDLEVVIDNGTHLMLSGNREVLDYAALIGGTENLQFSPRAAFDFMDLSTGRSWQLDLGIGQGALSLVPWMFDKSRQPPGFSIYQFVKDAQRLKRGHGQNVSACLDTSTELFRNFWEPMCVAVLNTSPDQGAAELLWRVIEKTVLKGGAFARPVLASNGLGAALVEPALSFLQDCGAIINTNQRIQGLEFSGGKLNTLRFADAGEVLGSGDRVILAVSHIHASKLIDGLKIPMDSNAILNVHYKLDEAVAVPRMVGVVGGACEWVQLRGQVASVTVSNANAWMERDADLIARQLWDEVVQVVGLQGDIPVYKIIKEKRATFAAMPEVNAQRPSTGTAYENLYLAGDWTNTGLPATIEGAVMSGRLAAETVLEDLN